MSGKYSPIDRESLSFSTKIAYGVSDLGVTLPLSSIAFFLLYFYTDVIHFSPMLAGTALLIAKAWDALSDPLMGQVSDRTESRWGRRRPYLLFAALPYAFLFILIWTPQPTSDTTLNYLFVISLFILFFTASTVVTVPYNALLPELALLPHERTKLTAYRQPFAVIGWVAGSALVLPLVAALGGGRRGYILMAGIFGAVALVVFLITASRVRERADFSRKGSVSIAQSFLLTFKNRPFWWFIAAYSLVSLGYTILSGVLIFYAKYWLLNEGLFTVMMGIVMGFLLLSIPLWVWVSGKIGKKEAFLIGIVVLILSAAAIFFLPPTGGAFLFVLMGFAGIGTGAYFLFPYSILPEIIDSDELTSGTRREGAYFGIAFLIFKISIALAPFITGTVLAHIGYIPDVPQTQQTLLGIRLLVGAFPSAFFVLGFIFLWIFPLNKRNCEQIVQKLSVIRNP
ncbi:MAG: MFS transporter [Deltaproteobacteria bacterium]|nr:MFS transporter [Candidatus Zymogenaceae bacterium]